MSAAWGWIVQNKAWVFSGIGVTVLAVLWWLIRKMFGGKKNDLPPGININVSPTISPTFNQSNTTLPPDGKKQSFAQPVPDIKALTYKAAFAHGIGTGKSCFIISFRNDGWADATNVIAHIGYSSMSSAQKFLVDYGGWIEHMPVMNIPRGHTKNLIIGVTETGKNFAVTDIGPATNYTRFELVEVGEITPGDWKMVVTLSADNFRRDYVFDLTVGQDGSFLCNPEDIARLPENPPKPNASAMPNVCTLQPEITKVIYDAETDVWSKGSGEDAIVAALLPFSNEPEKLKKTGAVNGIKARMTYYKGDGIAVYKRIDSGCWIGEEYRYADLGVGDIAYLMAAVQGNGQAAAVKNPRHSVARYSEDHTDAEELPAGIYEIKVELIGDDGRYSETFWFQLEIGEQLRVKRINQRPAMTG